MSGDAAVFTLGRRRPGDILRVTATSQANLRLMSSEHFLAWKHKRPYSCYGGLLSGGWTRMGFPHEADWYLVVDKKGLPPGSARCKVDVTPAPPMVEVKPPVEMDGVHVECVISEVAWAKLRAQAGTLDVTPWTLASAIVERAYGQ